MIELGSSTKNMSQIQVFGNFELHQKTAGGVIPPYPHISFIQLTNGQSKTNSSFSMTFLFQQNTQNIHFPNSCMKHKLYLKTISRIMICIQDLIIKYIGLSRTDGSIKRDKHFSIQRYFSMQQEEDSLQINLLDFVIIFRIIYSATT